MSLFSCWLPHDLDQPDTILINIQSHLEQYLFNIIKSSVHHPWQVILLLEPSYTNGTICVKSHTFSFSVES